MGEALKTVSLPRGILKFILHEAWLTSQVEDILTAGESYGNIDAGHGSRVQVEFVSCNPTGPMHAGNGRGAILGSALSNVLSAAGYDITKEYYFNDAGKQMEIFYGTLYARYRQCLGEKVEYPKTDMPAST